MSHCVHKENHTLQYTLKAVMHNSVSIAIISVSGVSGLTSVICSSLIIYRILSGGKEKLSRIQNRFLLAMSIIDILYSTACAISNLPIPKGECLFCFGNILTCNVQGFFLQLGLTIPGYVSMMSMSSFLSIVCNYSPLSRSFEIGMHAFAVLPMLIVALVGAVQKVFFSDGGYCWVRKTKHSDDSTDRGLNAYGEGKWVVIASIVWVSLTSVIIVFCMGAVYRKIRKRAIRMKSYDFSHQTNRRRNSAVIRKQSQIEAAANNVAKQTFLYVCAYGLTYIWSGLDILIGKEHTSDTLAILSAVFLPLQGFWNFLVYIHPRYIVIRREQTELSLFSALKIIIFARNNQNNQPRRRRMSRRPGLSAIKILQPAFPYSLSPVQSKGPNHPKEECCLNGIMEDDLDVENMEYEASSLRNIVSNEIYNTDTTKIYISSSDDSDTSDNLAAITKTATLLMQNT